MKNSKLIMLKQAKLGSWNQSNLFSDEDHAKQEKGEEGM